MNPLARRVLARFVGADLSPPLGDPGGPCQVMRRIEDRVRSPGLKDDLLDDVQHGKSLSNPDAAKVYPLDHEAGAGIAKNLLITGHAQYRMDLRGVTVEDVQTSLKNFAKLYNDLKSMGKADFYTRQMQGGEVAWIDPKTDLKIVFKVNGRESVTLITTFWQGQPDPRPTPLDRCPV